MRQVQLRVFPGRPFRGSRSEGAVPALAALALAMVAGVAVLAAEIGAAGPAVAADVAGWNPAAYAKQDTLEFRTTTPGEDPHWSTVWLVVLDGQVYVRLGSRAFGRVEQNQDGHTVAVRIGGEEFPKVKLVAAPDRADAVAHAMADKYRTDIFVRWMDHPLTARLEPEPTP